MKIQPRMELWLQWGNAPFSNNSKKTTKESSLPCIPHRLQISIYTKEMLNIDAHIELLHQKGERKCTEMERMRGGWVPDLRNGETSTDCLALHGHKFPWLNSVFFIKHFPGSVLWAILGKCFHKISKPYVCWQVTDTGFLVRKFYLTPELSNPTGFPRILKNRWKWEADFGWDLIQP